MSTLTSIKSAPSMTSLGDRMVPAAAFMEGSPRRMLSSTTASSPRLSCTMPRGTMAKAKINNAARIGGGKGKPDLNATTTKASKLPMVVSVNHRPDDANPASGCSTISRT